MDFAGKGLTAGPITARVALRAAELTGDNTSSFGEKHVVQRPKARPVIASSRRLGSPAETQQASLRIPAARHLALSKSLKREADRLLAVHDGLLNIGGQESQANQLAGIGISDAGHRSPVWFLEHHVRARLTKFAVRPAGSVSSNAPLGKA